MPERTLLYLGEPGEPPIQVWRQTDGEIECLLAGEQLEADSAAAAALRAQPPWVVMPAAQSSLLWLTLPTRRRDQAERALPYALEEWTLDNPAQLHATLGARPERDETSWRWPVLLVDAEWRRSLLDWLDQLGISALALIHPIDLEPVVQPGEWWASLPVGPNGPIWVAHGRHAGLRLPPGTASAEQRLADTLNLLPAAERPDTLYCVGWGEAAGPRLAALLSQDHQLDDQVDDHLDDQNSDPLRDISIRIEPAVAQPASWFETIATGRPLLSAIETKAVGRRGRQSSQWKLVGALAILLLVSSTGLHLMEGWQAARQADLLEQRIEIDFQQALPGSRLVNPQVQIEQALAELSPASALAGPTFLELVAAIAEAMQESPDQPAPIRLVRLDYNGKRLDARWESDDYDRLQQALQRLRGLPVQQVVSVDAAVEGDQAHMELSLAGRADNLTSEHRQP